MDIWSRRHGSSGRHIKMRFSGCVACGLAMISCWYFAAPMAAAEGEIEFNRDIRPILSNHCYACHGPDSGNPRKRNCGWTSKPTQKATGATTPPSWRGDRSASALYERITSDDPDERMPPGSTGKTLSDEQIEMLGKWIDSGAPWQAHWSYIKPTRAEVPAHPESDWAARGHRRVCSGPIEAGGSFAGRRGGAANARPTAVVRRDGFAPFGRGSRCVRERHRRRRLRAAG